MIAVVLGGVHDADERIRIDCTNFGKSSINVAVQFFDQNETPSPDAESSSAKLLVPGDTDDFCSATQLDGTCCSPSNSIVTRIIADEEKNSLVCHAYLQNDVTFASVMPLTVVRVAELQKIRIK